MKRFGALLLILCMLAGMLCVSAFTDAPETVEASAEQTEELITALAQEDDPVQETESVRAEAAEEPVEAAGAASAAEAAEGADASAGPAENGGDAASTETTEAAEESGTGASAAAWSQADILSAPLLDSAPTEVYLALGTTEGGTYSVLGTENPYSSLDYSINMSFYAGQEITLKAAPADGYAFKGWYEGVRATEGSSMGFVTGNNGTLVSSNAAYTFSVDQNTNLQAVFEPAGNTLTLHWSSVDGVDLMDPIVITGIADGTKVNDALEAYHSGWSMGTEMFRKDGYIWSDYAAPEPITEFSSWRDLYYSSVMGGEVINEDIDLYYAMLKEIDAVELTITPPVCGTETSTAKHGVTQSWSWGTQTNPPSVTIPSGVDYELDESDDYPSSYWDADETSLDPFVGTFEGGKTYHFETWLASKFGYCFADDASVTVNGGTYVSQDDDGVEFLQILGTVVAEHDPADPVKENEKAATCTATGSYDEVVYCSVCGEELSRTAKATETSDHTWGAWTVTKEATETEDGEETRTCSVCGETETRAIPHLKEESDVIPAFAGEQIVTVGKGDFEAPHYFDLAKDALATGAVTYKIGDSVYASDAELKAFLAAQSAGKVIECSFTFQGSGDYAGFSDSGTLTFTMVAAVDTAAITITAPKTGDALATSATVAGTAGGVSVDKDCLPVQSVVWSPADTTAAAETVYKVTITIQADRGVDLADTVSATVNGAAAGSSVSEGVLTVAYTFPATEPAAVEPTPAPEGYIFLNGENSTWAEGSSELYFRVNGDYDKFIGVKVDGAELDPANYTSASGSTVVNLKASYLATLSEGRHTLTVVYNDGEVSTTFTVKKAAADNEPADTTKPAPAQGNNKPAATSPKTGDESNIALWVVMLGASVLGLGAVLNRKRREN